METKKIGKLIQLSADTGYVHKIGTDTYVKSIIMLPSDTIEDFEEVDEIPPYTKSEYDAKVAELVRQRYSASEEFAVQRKMMNLLMPSAMSSHSEEQATSIMTEYNEYNSFVDECKEKAKNPELYKTEGNG